MITCSSKYNLCTDPADYCSQYSTYKSSHCYKDVHYDTVDCTVQVPLYESHGKIPVTLMVPWAYPVNSKLPGGQELAV